LFIVQISDIFHANHAVSTLAIALPHACIQAVVIASYKYALYYKAVGCGERSEPHQSRNANALQLLQLLQLLQIAPYNVVNNIPLIAIITKE
jgi:hypothetical protein